MKSSRTTNQVINGFSDQLRRELMSQTVTVAGGISASGKKKEEIQKEMNDKFPQQVELFVETLNNLKEHCGADDVFLKHKLIKALNEDPQRSGKSKLDEKTCSDRAIAAAIIETSVGWENRIKNFTKHFLGRGKEIPVMIRNAEIDGVNVINAFEKQDENSKESSNLSNAIEVTSSNNLNPDNARSRS